MICTVYSLCFFFQAEDGIRDLVRSRGLGDVYKRQGQRIDLQVLLDRLDAGLGRSIHEKGPKRYPVPVSCLLYTSDAADERSSVDLGGRRIIKKKKIDEHGGGRQIRQKRHKHE